MPTARWLRSVPVIFAVALAAPPGARAQTWIHDWTLCTPSAAFHSCHSISLRTDAVMVGDLRQGTLVSIALHNLQGQGYGPDNTSASGLHNVSFVRSSPIGNSSTPVTGSPSGGATGSPTWTSFTYTYDSKGLMAIATLNAIGGCSANALGFGYSYGGQTCLPDSWMTFSFALGDNVDANQFVAMVGALGPQNTDACWTDPSQYPHDPFAACDVRSESLTQVTPEPVTCILLGTGLLGLGGLRVRRRKRMPG